jgi:hypothetical protein
MQALLKFRNICWVAGSYLCLSVAPFTLHAQALPAMAPTSHATQTSPNAAPTAVPAPDPPMHAEVSYTNGELRIRADNSSLNQILRSISHVTGLKITGGVEEQRVFGSYGPAPLSTILATLLDGTGANVLLVGGNAGTAPELVLTSRAGGADLPGPNSPTYAMYDDSVDRSNPVPAPGAHNSVTPTQVQTPVVVTPTTVTPPAPAVRAPGQPLTPEMVAQELMQMQAQQDQQKKALDEKMRKQQIEQNQKLSGAPTQPPAGSSTPQ